MSFLSKIQAGAEEAATFAQKAVQDIPGAIERIPKVAEHTRAQVIGLLNPNRRHDDPDEKAQDEIRAEINASHRFTSFAGERDGNFVKWHIDGHDFMYALSEIIDGAKEVIFIQDWWLTPELYLRRPPAYHPEWRLDRLLKRKAEQGVKIHVIVYKEVTQTMNMNSHYTKKALEALHPNITCMRHPDHIGAKDSVEFWSHHEKVVVVDNHYASIGGLDLCFGRWDTHSHPLADVHPTEFNRTLFPGQDYNNGRVMDFHDVYNYVSNTLSIKEFARMPWHDVHMTMCGPAVLDIVQHFVERWNEIRKRKYRDKPQFEVLALPHNIESVARHPYREHWQAVGRSYAQRFYGPMGQVPHPAEQKPDPPRQPSCRVQAVRSVSDWSHGVLTERSIQNAYIQLIREANHYIYIENQFFISNAKEGEGPVKNLIAQALVQRIVAAAKDGKKFKVVVVIPEVPAFSGNIKNESALKTILAAQWRTISRGGHSIYEEIKAAGYEPTDYIRFYHLRTYDRINAPPSLISQMEKNSGVKFSEAQVALAREWIGAESTTSDIKEITVQAPVASKEGIDISDKTEMKNEVTPIPPSFEAAKAIVEKFEHGSDDIRGDEDVSDTVVQHVLEDETTLLDEKWEGTAEEELDAYVSELLYIHTKLMIVDDRRVIMGSANINDRSQKGDGDSEIALVVEDQDSIITTMDGKRYEAARFAASLRRKLYREHLGLIRPQPCVVRDETVTSFMRPAPFPNDDETHESEDELVADPLADATVTLWNDTARKNREIFTEIFRPVPTNLVRNWEAYDNYVPKVKAGHVVPDVPLARVKERLAQVKGALVEAPLDFLLEEKTLVEGAEWTALNPTLPIYI